MRANLILEGQIFESLKTAENLPMRIIFVGAERFNSAPCFVALLPPFELIILPLILTNSKNIVWGGAKSFRPY